MEKYIKNMDFEKVLDFENQINYMDGQVVSKTLVQNDYVSITLFALDKNEEIAKHKTAGDALVIILDGKSEIIIGEKKYSLEKGESIVMPSDNPHALFAREKFKMFLIVIFN